MHLWDARPVGKRIAAVGGLTVLALLMIPGLALAHQDGCHRWHSCPSDTGSYVCGDLGYACQYSTYDTKPNDGGPAGFNLNADLGMDDYFIERQIRVGDLRGAPEDEGEGFPWKWILGGAGVLMIMNWINSNNEDPEESE